MKRKDIILIVIGAVAVICMYVWLGECRDYGRGLFEYFRHAISKDYNIYYMVDMPGNCKGEMQNLFYKAKQQYDTETIGFVGNNEKYAYIMGENVLYIWDVEEEKEIDLILGFDQYSDGEMLYSWSIETEDSFLILGEKYRDFYDTEKPGDNFSSEGLYGDYKGSVIAVVDKKSQTVRKEYSVNEGPVIYMDENQYAVVKNEKITFYSFADGEQIREEIITGFTKEKDMRLERGYLFCAKDGKIKVYLDSKLLTEIGLN